MCISVLLILIDFVDSMTTLTRHNSITLPLVHLCNSLTPFDIKEYVISGGVTRL